MSIAVSCCPRYSAISAGINPLIDCYCYKFGSIATTSNTLPCFPI
jgi:hypothetical protein